MGYRLGVDLGTTRTSAAIDDGRGAAVMDLAPQAPTVPSVAFLSPDGTLLFGEDADRLAATDPARGARAFKRRVGDADPVVLAGRSFSPQELFAGFLAWTVSVAAQRQGAAPDELVVP
ncbi:MAG: Hsp70 family protein, partial [Nocardioidaceae bacterium]|nr:Hsp70 family protein [Nocardioidaceae bacterium]